MKKLLALSLVGSSLLLGSNPTKADVTIPSGTTFGGYNSGDSNNPIPGMSHDGSGNYTFTQDVNCANPTGTTGQYVSVNSTSAIALNTACNAYAGSFLGENASGDIIIGKGTKIITIKENEINDSDGKTLIKKTNNEIHIGENSLVTGEKNGRQRLYATDANGKYIPIDITNGTKLLINGRDVEQSINNVGALSAALTGLPTVPSDTTLACGFGTGTHGGDFAFSGGCASKVNEKLSINYAASMTMPGQDYPGDFEDQFSARAGFIWKLGKPVKPTLISMKEKKELETHIISLEEKNKQLLARLERLEKVALGSVQSKDLASNKTDFNSLNLELQKIKF